MMGVQYNLSKRTYAILNAGSWTGQTAANSSAWTQSATTGAFSQAATGASVTNDSAASSMYALTLVHDF
jgi:hypothetical protein